MPQPTLTTSWWKSDINDADIDDAMDDDAINAAAIDAAAIDVAILGLVAYQPNGEWILGLVVNQPIGEWIIVAREGTSTGELGRWQLLAHPLACA